MVSFQLFLIYLFTVFQSLSMHNGTRLPLHGHTGPCRQGFGMLRCRRSHEHLPGHSHASGVDAERAGEGRGQVRGEGSSLAGDTGVDLHTQA